MDFNATLLDAERGLPICKEFEKYPQIDIYESPIPQEDVAGNREITEATRVNIALHYGTPEPEVCVREKSQSLYRFPSLLLRTVRWVSIRCHASREEIARLRGSR